jgi:hypothetical protein
MTQTLEIQGDGKRHDGGADRVSDEPQQPGLIDVRAGAAAAPLRVNVSEGEFCPQQVVGVGAALLAICIAPASSMLALWSTADIGLSAFVLTFIIAFARAILLGLPLLLISGSKGWGTAAACAVAGFTIGRGPAAVLSWLTQYPQSGAAAPTIADIAARIAARTGYLTPPTYWGLLGALGGLVFWLVLRSFRVVEEPAVHVLLLPSYCTLAQPCTGPCEELGGKQEDGRGDRRASDAHHHDAAAARLKAPRFERERQAANDDVDRKAGGRHQEQQIAHEAWARERI